MCIKSLQKSIFVLANHAFFMKIIIAGASDVGLHLAKLLSFESQDITLIDSVKDTSIMPKRI